MTYRSLLFFAIFFFVGAWATAHSIADSYDDDSIVCINSGGTITVDSPINTNTFRSVNEGTRIQSSVYEDYFSADSLTSLNPNSTAGGVSTFSLDTLCEVLLISVTDPNTAPLPGFNAYFFNPVDANGDDITDISGNVNTTFRVRSAEAVTVDILFRSGGGTTGERTNRKNFSVPAGLDTWTEFTLNWEAADLAGFDPTDLRDMWAYIDRGVENFAGNEFYIDHFTIGTAPDPSRNTTCSTAEIPETWLENWDGNTQSTFLGSDVDRLNISIDSTCEEVKFEVADQIGNPYQALRPLLLDPISASGINFKLIENNPFVNIRARSAEDVELGVLLRSKDGTSEFRTDLLTQTIVGDLDAYSNLVFGFDETSLGGFDRKDFLDIWIYLDRDEDNFAGNEVYFDYVTLNILPATADYSPCGLPDLIIDNTEELLLGQIVLYPNPVTDLLTVQIPQPNDLKNISYEIINTMGQVLISQNIGSSNTFGINWTGMQTGIYWLRILSDGKTVQTTKVVKVGN